MALTCAAALCFLEVYLQSCVQCVGRGGDGVAGGFRRLADDEHLRADGFRHLLEGALERAPMARTMLSKPRRLPGVPSARAWSTPSGKNCPTFAPGYSPTLCSRNVSNIYRRLSGVTPAAMTSTIAGRIRRDAEIAAQLRQELLTHGDGLGQVEIIPVCAAAQAVASRHF